jgi:hypothetical protein
MAQFNSEVDDYIANAEDFAKPILAHWRRLVHEACPDATEQSNGPIRISITKVILCALPLRIKTIALSALSKPH